MAQRKAALLLHGAWHDHRSWETVIPPLADAGCTAVAIDLPGAGSSAPRPESFLERPLDPQAFALETSPNAGVTQEERTAAAVAAVRALNAETGGKAVVVGHSYGGLTVSHVAEAIPEEISAAVYVAAFMLPPGMAALEMIQHELMKEALVPSLLMADPAEVGALRMDVASPVAEYKSRVREAFYADLTEGQFERAWSWLHPDEPGEVGTVPSPVTQGRFGRVPRHYVECTEDRAVTLAGQREMVRLVDEAMGSKTVVHTMKASHSPFHSRPEELAGLIRGIAGA